MADDIVILVNGEPAAAPLEYHSHHSFDHASGMAEIKIAPQPGVPMPIHLNDDLEILINDIPVLTGHVHEVDGDDSWEHDFRYIHGRDKTQDFIDSTVGPQDPVPSPASLQQILQRTVEGMGLDFNVVDNAFPDPFGQGEVPSAGIDEFGFTFAERLAQQRQVVLTTDGEGNLVLMRNTGQRGIGAIFRVLPGGPSNIKSAKYRNTDLNRHNLHAVAAQISPNDASWEDEAKAFGPAQAGPISKDYGVAHDTNVRPERRKHHRAKNSLQKGKTRGAAAWRSSVAKARGFQHIVTVQGFGPSGSMSATPVPGLLSLPGMPITRGASIWWPGFVIPVRDDKYEIAADLLIVDVRFSRSWGGGSTTELTLTYKDSFSVDEAAANPRDDRTSKLGVGAPPRENEVDASELETEQP